MRPHPRLLGLATAVPPYRLEQAEVIARKPGDAVNLEIDPLARYVARLLGKE